MTGMFATSKAGHDKNKLYIIIHEDEEYVYLSDGDLKPIDRPKKKRKKHIQVIKTMDENVRLAIENKQLMNEEVKRAIKEYGGRII